MKTGSRYIAFRSRSLDLASGIDHTTVAAHLRMLRNEPDPLVYLIEGNRGLLRRPVRTADPRGRRRPRQPA